MVILFQTLRSLGVTNGAKVMVVGSTLNDVLAVSTGAKAGEAEAREAELAAKKESETASSKEKKHKKVLDRGKPEDAMPGIKVKYEKGGRKNEWEE